MNRSKYLKIAQKTLALLAVLFGAITLFAGFRVLAGADPGYVVFLPLLIYNTMMGVVYVGVGAVVWRNLERGRKGALVIFVLNIIVLAAIVVMYATGGEVAIDSLRAMTLRTSVWLVIFSGLWWLSRRDTNVAHGAGQ